MELESNPFAAPGVDAKPGPDSVVKLPLVFRQSLLDHLFLMPVVLVTGLIFFSSTIKVVRAVISQSAGLPEIGFSVIALFFGAGFVGSFTAAFCSVRIDSESIRINQLQQSNVQFKDVQSWHFHPVTKSVVITLNDSSILTVANSAMSRKRSMMLGEVLRKFVGPPG